MACRFFLKFATVVALAAAGAAMLAGGPAFGQTSITKPYLMSFDTCAVCTGPKSSLVQLAQSDDGVNWQLVPGYAPVHGGVPAVIRRGSTVYIFSDSPNGGTSAIQLQRYHMDTGAWDAAFNITLSDPLAAGPTIDPDAILNAQGQIVLIYDTNPQLCEAGICHLRQATEVAGSDGTQFAAQVDDMYTSTVLRFGDPVAFYDGTQYVVYLPMVSASGNPQPGQPNGLGVLTSTTLAGPYTLSTAFQNGALFAPGSPTSPIYPGWGTGFYNPARKEYWNYVTYQSVPAPPVLPGPIYRSVKSNFGLGTAVVDLTPVMTDAGLGLATDQITFHLHFAKNWSGNATTSAVVLPHAASVAAGTAATATVTLTNTENVMAADCYVAPLTPLLATFGYQATNASGAPIAALNTPVPVAGNGGVQNFAISITPATAMAATDVQFAIGCASTTGAPVQTGVNTLNLTATGQAPAVVPQTGFWWNPAEGGRGYNIEARGGNLFMATFLYDASGRTTWYGVGPGAMTGPTYTGTLTKYSGGQTFIGPYRAPTVVSPAGDFSVTFLTPTTATMTWPGGTIPLQKYDFGPGGSAATQPAGTPEPGWWWAPTQGGRGYAIEIQGGSLFLAGYMYDPDGSPIWFASGPTPMTDAMNYQGAWAQYGNGQTLTGAYRAPQVLNGNFGPVTIQFTTTTTGSMTFPNVPPIAIERYRF